MLKCFQRFYAETVASYSIFTFSLVKLFYCKSTSERYLLHFTAINHVCQYFEAKKLYLPLLASICHSSLICHAGKYLEIPQVNTAGGIFRVTLILPPCITLVFLLLVQFYLKRMSKKPVMRHLYQFLNVPSHEWHIWNIGWCLL